MTEERILKCVEANVMSGRQDRGARSGRKPRYDQRRGYETSAGSGRQSGSSNSSRFGNSSDTPPRFAHRQRNSDSRDGYYHEDGDKSGARRGGYSGKGRYDRDSSVWGGGGVAGRSSTPKCTYGKPTV